MQLSRTTQRFAAWLACVAMLLSVLVPVAGRLLAANPRTATWAEVCSADRTLSAGKAAQLKEAHGGHCALCCTGDGAGAPPVLAAVSLPLPVASDAIPHLFLQAPRPLFVWSAPPSRAPPVLV